MGHANMDAKLVSGVRLAQKLVINVVLTRSAMKEVASARMAAYQASTGQIVLWFAPPSVVGTNVFRTMEHVWLNLSQNLLPV